MCHTAYGAESSKRGSVLSRYIRKGHEVLQITIFCLFETMMYVWHVLLFIFTEYVLFVLLYFCFCLPFQYTPYIPTQK